MKGGYKFSFPTFLDFLGEHFLKWFEKNHRDTTYRECGLFIDDTKQFLGASPDLIVECSCRGKGVVEIKCPYSIVEESPTP